MAAAFALFAILLQLLLPAAAQAAQGSGGEIVICAIDGSHAVHVDQLPGHQHKGFAGLPCPDCLTAAVAVVLQPPPVLGGAPAVYIRTFYQPRPAIRQALARAPPRPLGQGPPAA
jgi:hypothetical protein